MRIPNKITISGVPFDVKTFKKTADNTLLGETDLDAQEIQLELGHKPEILKNTLLHEIIHAILHVTGVRYMLVQRMGANFEETLVRALEYGLGPMVDLRCLKGDDNDQTKIKK